MNSEVNSLRLVTESPEESGHERRSQWVREHYDRVAPNRDKWISRNAYFHEEDSRFTRFLVPPGLKILDLGCGTGHLLENLNPSEGVGIDISPKMIDVARRYELQTKMISTADENAQKANSLLSLNG